MELVAYFLAGYLGASFYEAVGILISKRTHQPPHFDTHGYRLHHSLYGLGFLLLGVIFWNMALASIGIGVIIQHYFTGDGLVFITKVR